MKNIPPEVLVKLRGSSSPARVGKGDAHPRRLSLDEARSSRSERRTRSGRRYPLTTGAWRVCAGGEFTVTAPAGPGVMHGAVPNPLPLPALPFPPSLSAERAGAVPILFVPGTLINLRNEFIPWQRSLENRLI